MTIADVSKKFDLSADTLRYYERIGLIPSVSRSPGGIRNYTEEDCRWVEFIKCMRGAGLPIEVLIDYVMLFQKGDSTIEARKDLLIKQREKLMEKMEEMRKTLDRLDAKIERYAKSAIPAENELKNQKCPQLKNQKCPQLKNQKYLQHLSDNSKNSKKFPDKGN